MSLEVRPPETAFAVMARSAVGAYEANAPAVFAISSAFLFLPGFAVTILLGLAGVAAESPLRMILLGPVLLLSAIGQGAITLIALDPPPGRTIGELIGESRREAGRVLLTGLLAGVATFLGFLCLVLPGFYLLGRLSAAVPAALIEDLPPWTALARSWELTRGLWGRVLGFIGLLSLMGGTGLWVALLVEQGLGAAAVRAGVGSLGEFAGEALAQGVVAAISLCLVIAQAAAYAYLRREEVLAAS